jgi:hypothetical protein
MIPKSSNLLVHIRYDSKRFKFTFTNTLNYFLLPDAKTNRKNKKIKYLQIMQKNLRLERKNSEKQECFFWWLKIIFRRYWKSWFVEIFFADIKQWMQKAKQTCQFFPTSKSQSHANHSFFFFIFHTFSPCLGNTQLVENHFFKNHNSWSKNLIFGHFVETTYFLPMASKTPRPVGYLGSVRWLGNWLRVVRC